MPNKSSTVIDENELENIEVNDQNICTGGYLYLDLVVLVVLVPWVDDYLGPHPRLVTLISQSFSLGGEGR